jgi:hypothetical protein
VDFFGRQFKNSGNRPLGAIKLSGSQVQPVAHDGFGQFKAGI